jgi:hypothetical protein
MATIRCLIRNVSINFVLAMDLTSILPTQMRTINISMNLLILLPAPAEHLYHVGEDSICLSSNLFYPVPF